MRVSSPHGTDSYRAGDNYAICDECGFKYRRSELRKRWDGLLVCRKDWEPRHPQELVHSVRERSRVRGARPETFHYLVSDDCSSATGWTIGAGWAHDSELHRFIHSSGTNAISRAITGLTDGESYTIQVLFEVATIGSVSISATSGVLSGDTSLDGSGQATLTLVSSGTTETISITPTTDYIGEIKLLLLYEKNE